MQRTTMGPNFCCVIQNKKNKFYFSLKKLKFTSLSFEVLNVGFIMVLMVYRKDKEKIRASGY
jgi:hypothetical protein